MDANLMSCPTCGHAVSNSASACSYCGALMEVQQPSTDEADVAAKAQEAKSPPSLPQEEAAPVDAALAEADAETAVDHKPDEQELPGEIAAVVDETMQTIPVEVGAETVADKIQSSPEPEIVDLAVDKPGEPEASGEQVIEPGEAKATQQESENPLMPDAPLPSDESVEETKIQTEEAAQPEKEADAPVEARSGSIPGSLGETISLDVGDEIQLEDAGLLKKGENTARSATPPEVQKIEEIGAETDANKIQTPPEPAVEELIPDKPAKPQALEEEVIELGDAEAALQELENPSMAEASVSSDEPVEEAKAHSEEAAQPKNEADAPVEARSGSKPRSLEETILLDLSNEIQLLDQGREKTARLEPRTEVLKIEQAAREMNEAIERQKKEELAKAQAAKKQKAALAKSRAQKKQKMILAKDAALKRKKAAQAKDLNLKNQSSAINRTDEAGKTRGVQSLHPNTKMRKLLEKYKGQSIGINYDNSAEIMEAQLADINSEYFRVFAEQKKLYYTYTFRNILTVIEGQDGVEVGESNEKEKFNAVIKVYPLVLF